MARVAPTNRPQNRKRRMLWFFGVFVVFLASLWFLGELVVFVGFVVFGRACGFWASLWFFAELVVFAELVDLRSKVVIKGKPPKNLTPQSKSC